LFLKGATNRPDSIDDAMLRRFTKRILVPLPNIVAREKLLLNLLENQDKKSHSLSHEEISNLAAKVRKKMNFIELQFHLKYHYLDRRILRR
jgi:SpoVK/Ycf46/Vps4 family AAA+-type ATPase